MRSPMYVTNDGDWCGDMDNVGLSHEDFLCFFAYFTQEGFVQELFSKELFYARVEVEWCHFGDYARTRSCDATTRLFALVWHRDIPISPKIKIKIKHDLVIPLARRAPDSTTTIAQGPVRYRSVRKKYV